MEILNMLCRKTGLTVSLFVLVLSSMLYAQIRSATITGTVRDSTGAVVPDAAVVATQQETGIATNVKTTAAGAFTAPYLAAGTYTVELAVPGFVPYRQTGIALAVNQTVRVDVDLKVGAIQQAVEVSAQAAQIQTDSSTVQGAIQSKVIDAIPNPVSNPLYYALLQAGVAPRVLSGDTTSLNSFGVGGVGRRNWSTMGVNGGRAFTNDIQLDGLPVMGGGYNEASVLPNTEGLQEVRVIANNFSAQYGHGQAVISMSTKSGTNQFHGQSDYTLRNEALNANNMYNNANGIARPAFKVNEFGGALGGPIIKDKLFFFSSYHYLRHNRGSTSLMTVPTAREAMGDFSQTFIQDANGSPVPAQIFDPYNVNQLGPDLFQRTAIPNAVIPNPNAYALKWMTFYPTPNRTPDDAFNTNNFRASTVTSVRRQSLNNRIDYRRGAHSFYGSGGLFFGTITQPRPFGKAPLNDFPPVTKDRNPYGQIGDTIILNPTTVVDVRFGYNRIWTQVYNGNKTGFDSALYDSFGVPQNIRPYFAVSGGAPVINPNNFSGGAGGGSNWKALTDGLWGNHLERQSNYNLTGSITKSRGSWTHKAGVEWRDLQSNYVDVEETTAEIASSYSHSGGNFNFQYANASGGVSSQNASNNQKGVNAAAVFLGVPTWWVKPGGNALPALSQKYFAVYSQNDWRATSKLTVNLGLRWDLQPGPTERYNRMAAIDLTAKNAFGYPGAVAFPGVGGYSRNLWDTVYNNWAPRLGAAYQLNSNTVLRAGYGITYLPSNSGYFASGVDYGMATFSSGTMQRPYGLTPSGVPVLHFWDNHPLNIAVGADPSAPVVYGAASKFDRHFKNGLAHQWNFFIERTFARSWFLSVGYSASHSANLMNRMLGFDGLQFIDPSVLAGWRTQYIASNGVTNPANLQVKNPFQPASGPLLGFTGALGAATLAQVNTLYRYPLFAGGGMNTSKAAADYNSLQVRFSHAFSRGFHMDLNYTWSKEIDNTDNMEDNQGYNSGGTAQNPDLTNFANNRRIGFSDIPHRLVATFLYDLPFGRGKALEIQNRALRAVVGDWQTGGSWTWQQGMPFSLSGANSGAALGRPDRVQGAPLEVPKELQHWYDGQTKVTLPDGRVIQPTKNTFLKYYEGAWAGRVIQMANGNYQPDLYWWGTAAQTFDQMRGPGRFNIDMSLRRTFKIRERLNLELAANATNILNNTQMAANFSGALGSTNTAVNAASGLKPGMGASGNSFGVQSLSSTGSVFDPRQVVMSLRLRF
jgi:trimeric autotransporter adhesin